jgi:cytochrome d ubiquinol oxidase subunit II
MTLVAFWFLVLTVLWVGFLVLDGFDFGVGMLHGVVGRDERGRRAVISTIGPLWDANEVWLIVATAGTFAAFPGWYATMFSGFYPVVLLVLAALILRGVAFEFRSHSESDRGRRLWGAALTGGSLLVPFGLGIVLGGLLGGVPIDSDQEFVGDLGDLLAPYALATGVTLVLLCLVQGATFLTLRTAGAALHARARRAARVLAPVAALVVLGFCTWTRVESGNGFLLSFIELAAVLAAIAAAVLVHGGREGAAFAATSVTITAVVLSLFTELYPRVMVSSLGAANDLTAQNTAAASYSLTVMTVVLAVLLPVVLLYQAWTYVVFRGRVRGPRVDDGEPDQVIPAPRREQVPAGGASPGDHPEEPTSPATTAGAVDSRRGAGPLPVRRLVTGVLTLLWAWLLSRLVSVGRPPRPR